MRTFMLVLVVWACASAAVAQPASWQVDVNGYGADVGAFHRALEAGDEPGATRLLIEGLDDFLRARPGGLALRRDGLERELIQRLGYFATLPRGRGEDWGYVVAAEWIGRGDLRAFPTGEAGCERWLGGGLEWRIDRRAYRNAGGVAYCTAYGIVHDGAVWRVVALYRTPEGMLQLSSEYFVSDAGKRDAAAAALGPAFERLASAVMRR